ncbi:hypothetical protein D9Q98_010023 [Chlorella vulgaris]|uniref:Uncharacterized protein n=1 Tax=Chlorella vulgaris TaxID=3077 RepID=A0A9D4TFZ0_CHLVU|nr:hypothetical protein D9Q98_010023 [Chlorella vulgaris]
MLSNGDAAGGQTAAPYAAVAAGPAASPNAPSQFVPLAGPPPAASPPEGAKPAAEPTVDPADYVQPTLPEEKHPQKPTWRRGYNATTYHRAEYLLCTLTPSDCSTKRLRPPREWYDSLLGRNIASFVLGAEGPDGSQLSFLMKAHAYEYVKSEYYVQGGETKRMFRVMGLQAGDGLKLTVTGKHSSIPTVRLTVIPAARNPNAAAILAQAAQTAAKREARLAAQPKLPKGSKGKGKRKKSGNEDTDGEDDGEGWEDSEEEGGKRRSRQRQRKHYGDEFVVGLDEAWNDASQSDDDYQPNAEAGGRRNRNGGPAWAPPPDTTAQVVSTGEAEGRNLLRIKINRPPTAAGAAAGAEVGGGKQGEAGGGKDGDSSCPLEFLAGLADDVATPQAGHLQQQQQQGPAASAAPPADPVVLLSKQLLRDSSGAINGASLCVGWEAGTRSTLHISRKLSAFGASQARHGTSAVETFEVRPTECRLELTLRLQQQAVGSVDSLEQSILHLLNTL